MYEIENNYYIDYTSNTPGSDVDLHYKHQINLAKGYANMKLGLDDFIDSLKEVEDYVKEGYFVIQTEKFIQESFGDYIYTSGDLYYNRIQLYHNAETLRNGCYHNEIDCKSIEDIKNDLEYAIQNHFEEYAIETDETIIENIIERYNNTGVSFEDGYANIEMEFDNPSPFDYLSLGLKLGDNFIENIKKVAEYDWEEDDFGDMEEENVDEDEIRYALSFINDTKDEMISEILIAAEAREEILQIRDEIGLSKEKEEISRDDEER